MEKEIKITFAANEKTIQKVLFLMNNEIPTEEETKTYFEGENVIVNLEEMDERERLQMLLIFCAIIKDKKK